MGCVSSKLVKKDDSNNNNYIKNGDFPNHVVSLTSSTYGALKLDQDSIIFPPQPPLIIPKQAEEKIILCQLPEVINTWELMSDLENEKDLQIQIQPMKDRSPFRRLTNHVHSPAGVNNLGGKENFVNHIPNPSYTTPKARLFKPWNFSTNSNDKLTRKGSSLESPRPSISGVSSSSSRRRRRRSLGPLFDPQLIESFEKELSREEEKEQEEEHVKKMVSPLITTNKYDVILSKYEDKCPPGGEHCVVIYTTTLRGIRKTFEDCNVVRSVMESYHIRVVERDISMDSGFKEELRKLMGRKEVKVPVVFVKGRLIGGANEVVKLDEDGKLEGMLKGISNAVFGCQGCGGIRFVMCRDCNGSCKVLDQQHKSMVRCGGCNENGLIHCPLCS